MLLKNLLQLNTEKGEKYTPIKYRNRPMASSGILYYGWPLEKYKRVVDTE
jgi:hypothetical protein